MSSIEFVHNNGGSAPHCNNDLQINHNNGSSTTNGNGNKIDSEQVLRGLLCYVMCLLFQSKINLQSINISEDRARETNNNNNFLQKGVSTLKIDPEGIHSPIGLESSALF